MTLIITNVQIFRRVRLYSEYSERPLSRMYTQPTDPQSRVRCFAIGHRRQPTSQDRCRVYKMVMKKKLFLNVYVVTRSVTVNRLSVFLIHYVYTPKFRIVRHQRTLPAMFTILQQTISVVLHKNTSYEKNTLPKYDISRMDQSRTTGSSTQTCTKERHNFHFEIFLVGGPKTRSSVIIVDSILTHEMRARFMC